jgi:hypothetical protein
MSLFDPIKNLFAPPAAIEHVQQAEEQIVELDVTDLTDGEAFVLAQEISRNAHEFGEDRRYTEDAPGEDSPVHAEMRNGRRILTMRLRRDAKNLPTLTLADLKAVGTAWDASYKEQEPELLKAEPFATPEEVLKDAGLPLSWLTRHEIPKDPDAEEAAAER